MKRQQADDEMIVEVAEAERSGAPTAFGQGLIGTLLGGDGLRAIAALMIFFAHVFVNADPGAAFENYGWAKNIVGRMDLGLGLFFALSGYLITRPFLRSFILASPRPSLGRYARNRALRIVPAFYVIAAIVLLRFGLDGAISPTPDNPSGAGPESAWWQMVSVFTFTQSYTGGSAVLPIGQAWSLDAEVAFYVTIPIAAGLASLLGSRIPTARGRAWAAVAFICFLGLVSILLRQGSNRSFVSLTSPPLIVFAFVPGIALAALEPLVAPGLRGHPQRGKRLAWAAAAVAVLACVIYAAWDYAAKTTALHQALGRRALMAVVFSGAVLAAVMAWQLGTERSPRWLTSRAITWVGERSYAIYLLHVWILFEVINVIGADAGTSTLIVTMIAIGLPVTLILSALSWRFVERPLLKRRRERPRGPGGSVVSAAEATPRSARAGALVLDHRPDRASP